MGPAVGPGAQSQAIFIPNELVGSIIGKGGAKINEVRQMSQCQIKINEPGEAAPGGGPNERVRFLDVFCCFFFRKGSRRLGRKLTLLRPPSQLVTITGQPTGIQTAIQMLYKRLEEEKNKRAFSRFHPSGSLSSPLPSCTLTILYHLCRAWPLKDTSPLASFSVSCAFGGPFMIILLLRPLIYYPHSWFPRALAEGEQFSAVVACKSRFLDPVCCTVFALGRLTRKRSRKFGSAQSQVQLRATYAVYTRANQRIVHRTKGAQTRSTTASTMARKNAAQKQAQREKLEQLARENPEQHQQKGEQEQEQEPKSKKQMHRKDKPWDVEGTDHWKVEPWNETDMPGPLLEESSFATVSRRLC
jgi:hypothetical protein